MLTDLGGFSLFCHSQAAPEYISILRETAEQNPCNRFLPEGFQLHELVCYSVIPHISRAVLKKKIKTISTENRSNKTRICTLVHTGDQSR